MMNEKIQINSLDIDDLILLHLAGPLEAEQKKGIKKIANQLELRTDAVKKSLSRLKESGMICKVGIEEREEANETKCYSLSIKGKEKEQDIWKSIKEKKITFIDDKDLVELRLKSIGRILGSKSIVHIIRNIDDDVLDIREEKKTKERLVGRDEELETLKKILDDLQNQDIKTIFITGDTGTGKSRLLKEFKSLALEFDYDLLKSNCLLEVNTPYAPLIKALEKFSKTEKDTHGIMTVDKSSQSTNNKVQSHKIFDAQRKSVFYGTSNFLKDISRSRPLILILEDLQWADKGTLNLLNYLSDRLRDEPVLIIGTYSPGDVPQDHPLTDTMRMMSRKKLYRKIDLEPLEKKETGDLISDITGMDDIPESFIDNMLDKTNGNPLFIKESVDQMMKENIIDVTKKDFPTGADIVLIPDIVEEVIEERIFQLDEDTRDILQVGSVIGKEIPFNLLVQASCKDEIELLESIDYLLDNNIWEEHPREDSFSFSHDLFVDTVYKGLGKWVEQKQLHLKVAKAMESVYEGELERRYSTIGHHYENAEKYKTAFEYVIEAAGRAENVYAHEDAIERYEEALKIANKTDEIEKDNIISILEELGYTYKIIGDYDNSKKYLEKALAMSTELETQRRLYGKIANVLSNKGEFEKVIEMADMGLNLVDTDKMISSVADNDEGTSQKDVNTPEICHLLSRKGWALRRMGRYQDAEEVFYEELDRAKELDDKFSLAKAYHNLGSFERSDMKTKDCIDYLKKSISLAKELVGDEDSFKIKYLLSGSYNNLGAIYAISGDLDNAAIHLESALEIHQEIKNKISEVTTLNNLSLLYKDRGDLEKSEELLKDAFSILKKIDYKQGRLLVENSRGVLYLEMGEFKKAMTHLENAIDIARTLSFKYKICDISNNISVTYIMKGNIDEGMKYADKALDIAEDIESNRLIGDSLKNKGKANRLEGNFDQAIKNHRRGIESAEISDETTTYYENIFELVKDHLAAGKTRKAREELDKVEEEVLPADDMENDFNLLKGIVLREVGEDEDSERFLTEALKGYEKLSRKYKIARIYYEIGQLKKRSGEDEEANRYLEKSKDLFQEMGLEQQHTTSVLENFI